MGRYGTLNMTMQTTGLISFTDIVTEFGGDSPHSLDEYYGADAGSSQSSAPPPPAGGGIDITTAFYEISNRFVIDTTTVDYTGNYDVGEVQTNFTGVGNIYLGVKVTSATTFYNDIPIAGVQILDSAGTTLLKSWIFNASSGSGENWGHNNAQIAGVAAVGFPVTPAVAKGYSTLLITTSYGTGKFGYATSTGSSNTGAAGGIGDIWKTTIAPLGDSQIAQEGAKYYAFRETSGSTLYSGTVMRGPSYTFSGGERIRVIHLLTGKDTSPQNPDDSLYIAVI
jgi:hypothetical protein